MSQTARWNEFVDTKARAEYERLTLLEDLFDPFTTRNLDRFDVRPGWRCLEVGAGAGSIARHLTDLAGPGNVVATDLSPDFLAPLAGAGVTVLRHDVTTDDAPGEFDLIHSRFVLDHLPEREKVIARMASWLRPNGWLLVESGTTMPEVSADPIVRKAMEALNAVLSRSVGTHTTWARCLPLPLEDAGLVQCQADALVIPARGGSPFARWLKATHQLVEEPAIGTGLITREELDEAFTRYEDPSFVDYTWMTVAAWGRRP